ncbi:MAG TPA: hypothetical protein DDW73_15390 [Rhizobium sp.]|nr:hypothetical protein [Rhizobium sp.]
MPDIMSRLEDFTNTLFKPAFMLDLSVAKNANTSCGTSVLQRNFACPTMMNWLQPELGILAVRFN